MYRSLFERRVAEYLDKSKVKFKYEPFELGYYIPKNGLCNSCGDTDILVYRKYVADFIVSDNIIIEAKGRFTSADRSKMRMVAHWNPEYDVRMMFQRDNFITKRHKKRYSTWCKDHNIPCAFHEKGQVPKWLTV